MSSDQQRPWWTDAVFYQVYPRSFADSDGDGVGDLDGVASRLDYLDQLGVDAVWLSPIMVSPMADHGYDVADPRDVDALFGGLPAFERLIAAAHERGIKITIDLVPNHTSSAHPWFQAALAAGPGTDARDRYIFRDGRGPGGLEPPNNWQSVFGGPSWTRVIEPDGNPGQWYLHLFDTEQPDLNWDNPEVFDDLEKTLRFWLERGVDGFRIDVAHGMAKPPGLPDTDVEMRPRLLNDGDPRFNHPDVHKIHRNIRTVMNDYPEAVTIGEVWVFDNASWAEYLRADELHLGFNFRMVRADFDIAGIRDAIENTLTAAAIENATAGVPTDSIAPARWRWLRSRCPARCSSTTVRSWGCPMSSCPTKRCRIRRGNAPGTPCAAATGVAFRFRGAAILPRLDSPHRPTPGCRSRRTGRPSLSKASSMTPTRRWRSFAARSKFAVPVWNSRVTASTGWTPGARRWYSPAMTVGCVVCSMPAIGRCRCRTAKSY
jgi:hypothetical protein